MIGEAPTGPESHTDACLPIRSTTRQDRRSWLSRPPRRTVAGRRTGVPAVGRPRRRWPGWAAATSCTAAAPARNRSPCR